MSFLLQRHLRFAFFYCNNVSIFSQKITALSLSNEPSHDVASNPDNRIKNRYKNIYPCKLSCLVLCLRHYCCNSAGVGDSEGPRVKILSARSRAQHYLHIAATDFLLHVKRRHFQQRNAIIIFFLKFKTYRRKRSFLNFDDPRLLQTITLFNLAEVNYSSTNNQTKGCVSRFSSGMISLCWPYQAPGPRMPTPALGCQSLV